MADVTPLDFPPAKDTDECYDGSTATPQLRDLSGREREIVVRMLNVVLSIIRFKQWPNDVRLDPMEVEDIVEIRRVLETRRPDDE